MPRHRLDFLLGATCTVHRHKCYRHKCDVLFFIRDYAFAFEEIRVRRSCRLSRVLRSLAWFGPRSGQQQGGQWERPASPSGSVPSAWRTGWDLFGPLQPEDVRALVLAGGTWGFCARTSGCRQRHPPPFDLPRRAGRGAAPRRTWKLAARAWAFDRACRSKRPVNSAGGLGRAERRDSSVSAGRWAVLTGDSCGHGSRNHQCGGSPPRTWFGNWARFLSSLWTVGLARSGDHAPEKRSTSHPSGRYPQIYRCLVGRAVAKAYSEGIGGRRRGRSPSASFSEHNLLSCIFAASLLRPTPRYAS
jgi:hypothetical protein